MVICHNGPYDTNTRRQLGSNKSWGGKIKQGKRKERAEGWRRCYSRQSDQHTGPRSSLCLFPRSAPTDLFIFIAHQLCPQNFASYSSEDAAQWSLGLLSAENACGWVKESQSQVRAWVEGNVEDKCPILSLTAAALHQLCVATWG